LNPRMTNVSMKIKHFSFSDPDDGSYHIKGSAGLPIDMRDFLTPLDGKEFITSQFHQSWAHDIKVVSTVTTRGKTVYQFSSNSRLSTVPETAVPQVRIYFDIELFSIWVKQDAKKWYDFLTSLLAILGGTFAVMRLLSFASMNAAGAAKKIVDGGNARKHYDGLLDTGRFD